MEFLRDSSGDLTILDRATLSAFVRERALAIESIGSRTPNMKRRSVGYAALSTRSLLIVS